MGLSAKGRNKMYTIRVHSYCMISALLDFIADQSHNKQNIIRLVELLKTQNSGCQRHGTAYRDEFEYVGMVWVY